MEWRTSYLDLLLVPCGLGLLGLYHAWLWHQVRTRPLTTIIGINAAGRRYWVSAMMRDNEKKNILAVQTLRNTIMGATLMATTSILLCSGMAAILSSTYSIKKPLNDTVYGGHGEFIMAVKYVALLLIFLFSFLCHSLSIRFLNQVNFLINSPRHDPEIIDDRNDTEARVLATSAAYVAELLERGIVLSTVGNRLFYGALPLLLWIFGPVLVFLCSATLVPLLYNLDVVTSATSAGVLTKKLRGIGKVNESNGSGPAGDHCYLSTV